MRRRRGGRHDRATMHADSGRLEAGLPQLLARTKRVALDALETAGARPVQERLRRFYHVESNYAGASFANLGPSHPSDISATDLLATTMLSVNITAGAARRLLQPGPVRTKLLDELAALPQVEL